MLTSIEVQAIAKLTTDSGSVGTGFLIDPSGLLLTAFHVLTRSTDPAALSGVTAQVVFHDSDLPLRARYLKGNVDDDWALLQLVTTPDDGSSPLAQPAPAELKPLPLVALQFHQARNATWSVFGYPAEAPLGLSRSGSFTIWDDASVELEANVKGMAMEGLSGAPILVDGEVVGITLAADLNAGLSVAGRLQIVPLSVVFADQQLPRISAQESPMFTLQLALNLPQGPDKYAIARDLLTSVTEPLGPNRVAAALLRADLNLAYAVCKRLQLEPDPSHLVLNYVASSAVSLQAAATLREFCQKGAAHALSAKAARAQSAADRLPVAAILRADAACACWYVLRATGGDFPQAAAFTPLNLEQRSVSLSLDEAWTPAEALQQIEQEGKRALGKRASACLAGISSWQPIGWFILHLDAPAAPAVHAAIVNRFPGAHVLVRVDEWPEIPPEQSSLFAEVSPDIERVREQQLVGFYNAAIGDF